LQVIIDSSCHQEAADIELSVLVELGAFNVLLNNVTALLAIVHVVRADTLYTG